MTMPELAAMNQTMSDKLLAEPAQPLVEGGYALRAVYTRGRRSGERRVTPLAVVRCRDRLYLVAPDRGRAWVRNLEADPACVVATADGAEERVAVPAPSGEAAQVVSAYLRSMRVPWALRAFPVAADAGLEEITAHLGSIAVFRLDER